MAGAIKGITVEIGGNTTKLNKALEGVNKTSKKLQSELKGVDKLLKMDPTNVTLLTQKQELLTKAIEETKRKLETLKSTQKQVQEQFDRGEITEEQFRDFQREIESTEIKLKDLTKELRNFGSVGTQQIAAVGEKMKTVGKNITTVGQNLRGVSTVAGLALGATAKTAIDFETAWAGVTKTVSGSEEQMEAIRQGILDLSQSTASSASDIAAVAENAGQLGVKTENILAFTETMVRLGDSTNLSADEASSAIAKLYNIMGADINTVDAFGAALVDLGNNFATTEKDILEMATRIAGSGKQIGLTETEILALAASLSSVGMEAEAGGSAISQVMTRIDKDTARGMNELKKLAAEAGVTVDQFIDSNAEAAENAGGTLITWAEVAGMSVENFANLWENDAMAAMQKVISGMGDASRGGENLNLILDELGITSIRQSDSMKRLSGASELLGEAVDTSRKAWGENTALTAESEKRYETTAAKIQQLKGTLTELCVQLGEILLPVIQKVIDGLKGVIEWFSGLSPEIQSLIIGITGVVAVASPLLIFIGKIVSAIGSIMTILPKLAPCINAIKTATSGLLGFIKSHPIVAIIAAIVAVLIYLWNNCEWFRNAIKGLLGNIGEFFANFWNKIKTFFTDTIPNAWNSFIAWCKNAWNSVITFFTELPNKIWTWLKNVGAKIGEWFRNLFTQIGVGLTNAFSAVLNFFKELPNKIAYALGFIIGTIIKWGQDLWNYITTELPLIIGEIVNWFASLPEKIWTWLENCIGKIGDWGAQMLSTAITSVSNLVTNVVNWFKQLPNKIWTSLKNGISKVKSWGNQVKDAAVSAIKNMVSGVVQWASELPGKIGNAISGCISKVTSWGSQRGKKAGEAMKKVVSSITEAFKNLPRQMAEIGENILDGLWDGIKNTKNWLIKKIKGLGSSLVSGIKDALGIHSPSRVFRDQVGRFISEGIGVGIEKNADAPLSAIDNLAEDMANEAELFNGATINRKLTTTFSANAPKTNPVDNKTLLSKLDSIADKLGKLKVVLNNGVLVGEILDDINVGLADKQLLEARGV